MEENISHTNIIETQQIIAYPELDVTKAVYIHITKIMRK